MQHCGHLRSRWQCVLLPARITLSAARCVALERSPPSLWPAVMAVAVPVAPLRQAVLCREFGLCDESVDPLVHHASCALKEGALLLQGRLFILCVRRLPMRVWYRSLLSAHAAARAASSSSPTYSATSPAAPSPGSAFRRCGRPICGRKASSAASRFGTRSTSRRFSAPSGRATRRSPRSSAPGTPTARPTRRPPRPSLSPSPPQHSAAAAERRSRTEPHHQRRR